MDIIAKTKYTRMSASKARDIARDIRGLPVAEALKVTEFSSRKAAFVIGKTLKSAIANATNNADLPADDLIVKEAIIQEGPSLRRYWARARGSASPIRRKMAHVRITLTDGKEEGE